MPSRALATDPSLATEVRITRPFDLLRSLSPLAHGTGDPTTRLDRVGFRRATRTPSGPATMEIRRRPDGVAVRAWGPGAEVALAHLPDLLGARDDRTDWNPCAHPLVAELDRRHPGLRMISSWAVFEAIVPTVCEQKVTAREALAAWRRMVRRWGQPAPGPFDLLLPPPPETLATARYHEYHRFGLERRRAETIRRLSARSSRVEEAALLPPGERRGRLEAFPGVGPWTSADVAHVAWGDADAVLVGDYHVAPNVVFALTGRRGGDDDAMLELLEPFRPHRARAARLLMLSGRRPGRRAPGRPLRDIRHL